MNFAIEDYDEKTVMHCPEEWMAKEFLNYLTSKGRKWITGIPYEETRYNEFKENTAYQFTTGQFGRLDWFIHHGYKILEFKDFVFGDDKDFTVEKEDADCIGAFLNNFSLN